MLFVTRPCVVVSNRLRPHVKRLELLFDDFCRFVDGSLSLFFLCEKHVLGDVGQELSDEHVIDELDEPGLHLVRGDHLQLGQVLHLQLVAVCDLLFFLYGI